MLSTQVLYQKLFFEELIFKFAPAQWPGCTQTAQPQFHRHIKQPLHAAQMASTKDNTQMASINNTWMKNRQHVQTYSRTA